MLLAAIAYILLLLLSFSLQAEEKTLEDSLTMQPVTITATRYNEFGIGNNALAFDSATQVMFTQNTLSDLLNNESTFFIRSYGLGGLATISIRGSSSTQTAILWNGFNVQSPMNANYDLSLIPVFFLEKATVQMGSSGALFGSGAIGGTIHLNNKEQFNSGIKIQAYSSFGSFKNINSGLGFSFGNQRWFTQTKIFYKQAVNDFPFQNIAQFGKPEQRLSNAALWQYGVLHQQSYNLLKKNAIAKQNLVAIKLWCQKNNREIPPSMTMQESKAFQQDDILRITASWNYDYKKWSSEFRNAYFKETILFNDSAISLNELYVAQTAISEWEHKLQFSKRHLLQAGVNYTFNTASSENYTGINPIQNRGAFFASYRYTDAKEKLVAVAALRKEIINNMSAPFTPSIAVEYQLLKVLKMKSNVSRNFKVPTFNDWYWTQGGNPNLKPENGWGAEIGAHWKWHLKRFTLNAANTFFANSVKDRIIWLPNDLGIWTPENVSKVLAKGLENVFKIHYLHKAWHIQMLANYQWVTSVQNENVNNPQEEGKQLIYVPINKGLLQGIIAYKKTQLQYQHQFTGQLFVTADNTKRIERFQIVNIFLSQQINWGKAQFLLTAKANNIFNTTYQVIQWRAMPGRNFEIGLQFFFQHKKTIQNN